jgi:rubrerythrin
MPTANSQDKAKIVSEFATMKSFELSARDLYREIAGDLRVAETRIRDAFRRLAEDEHRHAELVQEIIDLIGKTL